MCGWAEVPSEKSGAAIHLGWWTGNRLRWLWHDLSHAAGGGPFVRSPGYSAGKSSTRRSPRYFDITPETSTRADDGEQWSGRSGLRTLHRLGTAWDGGVRIPLVDDHVGIRRAASGRPFEGDQRRRRRPRIRLVGLPRSGQVHHPRADRVLQLHPYRPQRRRHRVPDVEHLSEPGFRRTVEAARICHRPQMAQRIGCDHEALGQDIPRPHAWLVPGGRGSPAGAASAPRDFGTHGHRT